MVQQEPATPCSTTLGSSDGKEIDCGGRKPKTLRPKQKIEAYPIVDCIPLSSSQLFLRSLLREKVDFVSAVFSWARVSFLFFPIIHIPPMRPILPFLRILPFLHILPFLPMLLLPRFFAESGS